MVKGMETDIAALEQHLLYHKAMAESPEEVERINGYLETLRSSEDRTRFSDPVEEAIRGVFSLVIESGMDPWNIDLENFVRMYSERVAQGYFDMVVAGKLIYMAWTILGLQAQESGARAEPPVEDFDEFADDFATEDEDENLMAVPDVTYIRASERVSIRSITMIDIMDALDEAVQEQEILEARRETLEKLRAERQKAGPAKFDNKAHEEDDETVVKRVYKKIIEKSAEGPIPMRGLYNGDLKESISCFVSVLHLVRYGLLEIEQAALPSGEITIRVVDPTAEVPLSAEA